MWVSRHSESIAARSVRHIRQHVVLIRALSSSVTMPQHALPPVVGSMRNARGNLLHTVHYKVPSDRRVKAALLFHHGLGEHVGRYDSVFQYIASCGFAVHALDAHGHGRSEPGPSSPDRCLIMSFGDLVHDFSQYIMAEVLPLYAAPGAPRVPLFIGGQSMGGLVACHTVLRDQPLWAGLILHSAAIDASWTPILRLQAPLGNLMASVIPRARIVPAVRPEDMSQDQELVRRYVEDPLNFVGNVRARTANEILKGFRSLQQQQHRFELPIYACHGTLDKCTSLPAVQVLLKAVKSKDVTLNMVEGGYHELLHGPEAPDCIKRIVDWMAARSGPAPLPAAHAPAVQVTRSKL